MNDMFGRQFLNKIVYNDAFLQDLALIYYDFKEYQLELGPVVHDHIAKIETEATIDVFQLFFKPTFPLSTK